MACGRTTDVTAIPLGRRSPGASSNQPGRPDPDKIPAPMLAHEGRTAPIRFCSRWGLPCRRRCRRRGALLPHRFTLTAPARRQKRRSVLCGTIPGFAPAGRYPAPLVHGARTFLPGNLSVSPERPSSRLTCARDGGGGAARQGRKSSRLNQVTRPEAASVIDVRARAAIVRPGPRCARSSCKVLRVEASKTPSTRSGRK